MSVTMASYRHLHHRRGRNGTAHFQRWRGSIPVAALPSPQTHVYLYPYIGWFPLEYIWNMGGDSDESAIDHHHHHHHHRTRMTDDNLVIDASTTSNTTLDQQMVDGHSIIDLDLPPSYYSDQFSGQEEQGDVQNRNRVGRLSEEAAISKHIKTRAATQEDTCGICTVCQDDLHEEGDNDSIATVLDCGHEYHASCIKRWLREKNVCPLCRIILS